MLELMAALRREVTTLSSVVSSASGAVRERPVPRGPVVVLRPGSGGGWVIDSGHGRLTQGKLDKMTDHELRVGRFAVRVGLGSQIIRHRSAVELVIPVTQTPSRAPLDFGTSAGPGNAHPRSTHDTVDAVPNGAVQEVWTHA